MPYYVTVRKGQGRSRKFYARNRAAALRMLSPISRKAIKKGVLELKVVR